ncbi:CTCFL protein, partial [Serilophus lunatus]|nr:CTCFL protein [Serilophus lunatus]
FTSARSSDLRHPLKTHSDEKHHMCHLCPEAFHTAALLHSHVNTHTGTKTYKCSECDTAFVTRGELSRRRRYKHTSEKPFKCTICGYCSVEVSTTLLNLFRGYWKPRFCVIISYGNLWKLAQLFVTCQLTITLGKKHYECCVCQARFTQSGTMKIHMLQKHGENVPRHQCPHCSAFISQKRDLDVHLRNLHSYLEGAMKCSACGAVFHEHYAFLQHRKTHRGGKRLKCAQCNYICNQ